MADSGFSVMLQEPNDSNCNAYVLKCHLLSYVSVKCYSFLPRFSKFFAEIINNCFFIKL